MRRCVAALLLAAHAHTAIGAEDAGEIQPSIHFSADLTRDGRPEQISIEFAQHEIHRPFSWVLAVRNADGKVIYFDPRDDEGLDEALSEAEEPGACGGYEACKRQYYFTLLPAGVGRCLEPATAPFLDSEQKARQLEQVAGSELRSLSLEPARIEAAIAEMKAVLQRPGHMALCAPEGPDLVSAPMIWVEAVQRFVTYHRP